MDKKNTFLLTVIAVATLLVAIVGATFAYFTAQTGEGKDVQIEVTTSTSDTTLFSTFDRIAIRANQSNFGKDAEGNGIQSLRGMTKGYVSFVANSNTQEGNYCYNVDLQVSNNNFIYSLPKNGDDYYPELVLNLWKGTLEGEVKSDLDDKSISYTEYTGSNFSKLATAKTLEDEAASDKTVPYKENIKTGKVCDTQAIGDTFAENPQDGYVPTESAKCEESATISGYDITLVGYNGSTDTETAKFDFSGITNGIHNQKVIKIPLKQE